MPDASLSKPFRYDKITDSKHPLKFFLKYRRAVVLGVLLLIGTNLCAQAVPKLVQMIVDTIESAPGIISVKSDTDTKILSAGESQKKNKQSNLGSLNKFKRPHSTIYLLIILLCAAVLQLLSRIPSRILIFNAGREAEYELRRALATHLMKLDGQFYLSNRSGDLMSLATNDISAVRALFGPGVLHSTNTLLAYAISVPIMMSISIKLTLIALFSFPVILLSTRSIVKRMYGYSIKQQTALASMTSTVQEDLSGINEIKAYQLETLRQSNFNDKSAKYMSHAVRVAGLRLLMTPMMASATALSQVLVFWIGGQDVLANRISVGELIAINLFVANLAWPTLAIGWMLSMWQRGIASWSRIQTILKTQSAIADISHAQNDSANCSPSLEPQLQSLSKSITPKPTSVFELRNVYTSPTPDIDVLKDISLDIPSGAFVAFVGRTGSGKTTLIDVLTRLVPPSRGTYLYKGHDVKCLSPAAIRNDIAYAPQDSFLFSISILENILLDQYRNYQQLPTQIPLSPKPAQPASRPPSTDLSNIDRIIDAAGLTTDLAQFPNGLDTVIGERGVTLSGGQKQRLSLARALAANRPTLILDDTLSALDAETESEVLEKILTNLRKSKTIATLIVVSHRLSAVRNADVIYVLDQGKIVQSGTYDTLSATPGVFQELYLSRPRQTGDTP